MIRYSILIGTLLAPFNAVADPIVELAEGYLPAFSNS
jgi:hypothetical protein